MSAKERFKKLGYKLEEQFFVNIDRIYKPPFYLDIEYDKKKITAYDSNYGYSTMSKEFLEILYDYLKEKGFFKDE